MNDYKFQKLCCGILYDIRDNDHCKICKKSFFEPEFIAAIKADRDRLENLNEAAAPGVCEKCRSIKSLGTVSHKWNGSYLEKPGRCFKCDPLEN